MSRGGYWRCKNPDWRANVVAQVSGRCCESGGVAGVYLDVWFAAATYQQKCPRIKPMRAVGVRTVRNLPYLVVEGRSSSGRQESVSDRRHDVQRWCGLAGSCPRALSNVLGGDGFFGERIKI